jgi:hypothetical protein
MLQICVPNQKVQKKNRYYVFETFLKCNDYEHQNTQYFCILLKFHWNIINVFNFFIL